MTMGHIHPTEPVMDYDKKMSKAHKAHRRQVDMIENKEDKLKMSIKYNKSHAKEHVKALKESRKRLSKMGK